MVLFLQMVPPAATVPDLRPGKRAAPEIPLESWICGWDLLVAFLSLRGHFPFTLKVEGA